MTLSDELELAERRLADTERELSRLRSDRERLEIEVAAGKRAIQSIFLATGRRLPVETFVSDRRQLDGRVVFGVDFLESRPGKPLILRHVVTEDTLMDGTEEIVAREMGNYLAREFVARWRLVRETAEAEFEAATAVDRAQVEQSRYDGGPRR